MSWLQRIPLVRMWRRQENQNKREKLLLQAEQAFSTRGYSQCVQLCEQLLADWPELSRVWFLAGSACLHDRRWADAARYFTKCIERERDHEDGVALLYRGDSYRRLKQVAAARADYDAVLAATRTERIRESARRGLAEL
jgi:uncharacterized protein HemY